MFYAVCINACVIAESLFSIPGMFLHRDPGKRTVPSLAVSGVSACIYNLTILDFISTVFILAAPSGLQGCKNRSAPFRGRMSYKATNPG